jgi:hypothetical protein
MVDSGKNKAYDKPTPAPEESGKYPESKQRPGSFPWMVQRPPKLLGDRPISPRENLRRLLLRQDPVWMPVWITDSQYCWPDVVLEHPPYEMDGKDWYGTEWVWVEEAGGMMVKPGTRVISDITNWKNEVVFPDLEAIDWEEDAKRQTAYYDPERMHFFHLTEGLFERLHELMPFDEALVAMMEEPETVLEFFSAVADFKIRLLEKVFKYYAPIDYIIYGDDWGTQRAGFFSNDMFREMIMPHTKRIIDYVKSQGKFVELHSCGLNQQYVPMMIELGIDWWSPQPINDFDYLTSNFGDRMAFTVPIPGINDPDMAESEVRKAVRDYVDKYGKYRVVATIQNMNPELQAAAGDELYKYSLEFYAKRRS